MGSPTSVEMELHAGLLSIKTILNDLLSDQIRGKPGSGSATSQKIELLRPEGILYKFALWIGRKPSKSGVLVH